MTRRRLIALAAVWILPGAVFVALAAAVYGTARIAPAARLPAGARAAVIAPLRAALDGHDAPPCTVHAPGDTVAVTVWLDGRAEARVDGRGRDLGAATDAAARLLRGDPALAALPAGARARARIQVDVIGGRAPLRPALVAALGVPGTADLLAIDPGVDGIGGKLGGRTVLVLPHELVQMELLAPRRPPGSDAELATGVDRARITTIVGARAGVARPVSPGELFRFHTDAFVEPPGHAGPPLPLVRGVPPAPAVTSRALREAALAGGRYLVAHLAPDGRFVYEHDVATGARRDPVRTGYPMARHAGTAYFLAELYRITREPWLREPVERAVAYLAARAAKGGCGGTLADGEAFACVLDRGDPVAQLGSTALAAVALAEYQRATGDARYLPLARALAAFVLEMQRPDGSFRHLYDPRANRPDERAMVPYASGEAALALARMHAITGEPRYRDAAARALDWLVGWYDFFLGGFFYGEEHWTCLAAEAISPAVARPAYRAFCDGYAAQSRREQDGDGGYGLVPFAVPDTTPAGSRTEAMLSAYLLDARAGAPDPRLAGQIRRALGYLLGQQLRPDSDFAAVGDVDGGIPASAVERTVRIDYVQHACSAMIRASELIDSW